MAFYVLGGIVFVANIVNDLSNAMLEKSGDAMRQKVIKLREHKENGTTPEKDTCLKYGLYRLGISFGIFAFFALSWMIYFATMEKCSCSYGKSAVEGCTEANCETSGAQTKNWLESFYMAVITMTTVGFGDFTPVTLPGRLFGSVWMVLGVLATGNMITAVSATIDALSNTGAGSHMHRQAMTKDAFKKMDLDGNKTIDRGEFLRFVLLREGIISEDTLGEIDALFDSHDHSGTGEINKEDLKADLLEVEQHD